MAAYTVKLQRTKYHNWLKAGLALLITKEGIEDFVYEEIEDFQIQSLADICTRNGLHSGTVCSTCCTANILRCPTAGVCKVKRGTCNVHDNASSQYRACPNQICDDFRDCIRKAHRYHGPSYKNTDAAKWCSTAWEVAKCFMPPDGYSSVKSVAETDFNGVLSVIISHRAFQNKIADDLSKPSNIACQAREVGKQIRHSPDFEVDTATLTLYFKDLTNLLCDRQHLHNDQKAKAALGRLHQLQNDTLFIRVDDVQKVLDDAASVLQNRITTDADRHKQNILTKAKDALIFIETEKQNCLDAVSNTMSLAVAQLQLQTDAAKNKITDISRTEGENLVQLGEKVKKETHESLEQERTSTEETIKDATKTLQTISKDEQGKLGDLGQEIRESIKESGQKEKETLERINIANEKERYDSFVKGLQHHLAFLYKNRCRYLPISPILKEEEELLEDFYVPPSMQRVEHHKVGVKPVPLKTYEEVFSKDGERCRRIFVTGEAGTGKTVFCQRMVLAWCEATAESETIYKRERQTLRETDVNFMKQFKFLFFVSLQDAQSDECYIHELISSQLQVRDKNTLLQVLQKENCLILIDGLDEWDHPASVGKCDRKTGQPHIDFTESCTIVSTTRPWKLEVLQLGKRHIDQKIDVTGFQNPVMMRKYVGNIIKLLNERTEPKGEMTIAAFEDKIKDSVDEDLKTNPLIVLNLICLCFMRKSLGPSKCKIYSDSLEMILERSSDRDGQVLCNQQLPDVIENGRLVSVPKVCFKDSPKCREHLALLFCVAELAFKTLLCERESSSLVFEPSLGKLYGLSNSQIETLCKIGILSRSKVVGNLLSRETKISFIHKTYHEFFAALYICFCGLSSDISNTITNVCQSIENIVEMQNVFIFLSGMAPCLIEKLGPVLRTVIGEDLLTKSYRRMIDHTGILKIFERRVNKAVRNVETLACKCYRECKHAVGTELGFPVEDFFIESQASREKLSLLKLSTVKSVVFHNTFTDDFDKYNVEKLSLLSSLSIELRYTKKESFPISDITGWPMQKLKCLVLDNGTFVNSAVVESQLRLLQSTVLKQIEVISLKNMYLNRNGFYRLIENLGQFQQLKQLRLAYILQDESWRMNNHFDISCFQSLEELAVIGCEIDIAINSSKLERCCIQKFMRPSQLISLEAPRLQTLMYYGYSETDVLASALLKLDNLRQVEISHCRFLGVGVSLLLHKNMRHLNYVSLMDVKFSEKSFKDFLDSLPEPDSPMQVALEGCCLVEVPSEISDTHTSMHDIVANMSRFQIVYKYKTKLKFKTESGLKK